MLTAGTAGTAFFLYGWYYFFSARQSPARKISNRRGYRVLPYGPLPGGEKKTVRPASCNVGTDYWGKSSSHMHVLLRLVGYRTAYRDSDLFKIIYL